MAYFIERLDRLNQRFLQEAVAVLVISFHRDLAFLNRTDEQLIKAIAPTFRREQMYVAIENDKVIGLAVYSTLTSYSQVISLRHAIRSFGIWKGYLCWISMNRKPIRLTRNQCYIEDVATHPEHRRKGVAHALMNVLMQDVNNMEYVLEVVDTNDAAISVYTDLGFHKYHAVKENKHVQKTLGYSERQYMKRAT
ncbi:GNAT family N-acetyltransferase [Geomicrobium sp. JCM 19039]|uniref:GNAT family N-acetyltransferase n=1 Tax=Geomicrobium sp. JCM 19039 TaxID=1460636 RepID=UPI00045F22D3|nr:GNAT family N-acetyltransferase [Geomicrobium sp. JCM 19039]GAK13327.1 hypothetical protein JCM19039_3166 [Geomicrobium sp. JCM 19039]